MTVNVRKIVQILISENILRQIPENLNLTVTVCLCYMASYLHSYT